MSSIEKQFKWAIPLSDDEKKEIWGNGILTVDTNVLLNLYRYPKDTREEIFKAIESFGDRVWLPYQVLKEYFNNRIGVITEAVELHNDGRALIKGIDVTIGKKLDEVLNKIFDDLHKNKSLSKKIINETKAEIYKIMNNTKKETIKVFGRINIEEQLDFSFHNDQILERILMIFNNHAGAPFTESELKEQEEIARQRFEQKVPPGYKDNNKEYNQYGDYFLWRQILDYAKGRQGSDIKNMIFVTADMKEDWWIEISGQTVGPRFELLQEVHLELEGKNILFYETTQFLEMFKNNSANDSKKLPSSRSFKEIIDEINIIQKDLNQKNEQYNTQKLKVMKPNDGIITLRQERRSRTHKLNRAVKLVKQEVIFSNNYLNYGEIICKLTRSTQYFTVSGKLIPNFSNIGTITASMEEAPDQISSFNIITGAGTQFDFNISCRIRNDSFPEGYYKFHYVAFDDELGENYLDEKGLRTYCPECGDFTFVTFTQNCYNCGFELLEKACESCGDLLQIKDLPFYPHCAECEFRNI